MVITTTRSGGFFIACNQRVEKAVISPSLREQKTSGSSCLPEVAIYSAGFRNGRKDATHIFK